MNSAASSPIRRVLLVHNSPRVGRYFSRLASGITSPQISRCRVFARFRRGRLPSGTIDEIIDYGMRRKRARGHYGPARLAALETVYAAAARLHYDHVASAIVRSQPDVLGVWGGNAVDAKAVVVAARHAGLPCFRFENGFLPDTTQMDLRGVNVESSVPRDPEFYRSRGASSGPLPDRIVPRKPHRGKQKIAPIQLPERYVFVPFQVQLDSQILLHSPWIHGMRQFFEVLTESASRLGAAGPTLVFKEHPSCPEPYPDLHAQAASTERVYLANGNATEELIRNAVGVVTINSTVGTESLLLEKPVLALGNAVYEVAGVASSARTVDGVADWLDSVWGGHPPDAPLRRSFVQYLLEDYLVPGRHQQPGPSHIRAVEERLNAADPFASAVGAVDP